METEDLVALQLQREEQAYEVAALKLKDSEKKKAKRGDITEGERRLFPKLQEDMENQLRTMLDNGKNRKGTHIEKMRVLVDYIGYDVVAAIVCRITFDVVLGGSKNQRGSYYLLTKNVKEVMEALLEAPRKGKASTRATKARHASLEYIQNPEEGAIVVPALLMEAMKAIGAVDITQSHAQGRQKHSARKVEFTEAYMAEWEAVANDPNLITRSMSLMPMVAPPDPYRRGNNTGFYSPALKSSKRFEQKIRPVRRMSEPKRLWDVMNAIQEVPLRINRDVLALQQALILDDANALLVQGDDAAILPVPETEGIPEEKLPAIWRKRKYAKAHNRNAKIAGMRTTIFMKEAERLSGRPVYLACFPDWRARLYAASAMSHQGKDAVKALFEFWNGKPLGPHGLRWLKIHTATQGDFPLENGEKSSKSSMDDRVKWVDDNTQKIRDMVADPLANMWWTEADMPFVFYAVCCDLVRALDYGYPEAYVSHIPTAIDGANSGLQHYAAACRAPEGQYVSLTPSDKPVDFYRIVADKVKGYAEELVAIGEPADLDDLINELKAEKERGANKIELIPLEQRINVKVCQLWLKHGVSRSVVKRSAMTYVYSAAAFGFTEQVMEDFMQPRMMQSMLDGTPFEWGCDDGFRAALWIGHAIFRAVSETVPLVYENMKWLQKVAALLASEGLPVEFETPMGFPVRIRMEKAIRKEFKVSAGGGQDVRIFAEIMSDKLDARKQTTSTPPNTIHACDGCHLQMTAIGLLNQNITDFLFVHDEFAAHAGSMQVLRDVVRQAMVELYKDWSPMWAIYEAAGMRLSDDGFQLLQGHPVDGKEPVGPPPAYGSLSLSDIPNADYAFA